MKTGSVVNLSYGCRIPKTIDVQCKVLEENGNTVLLIKCLSGFGFHESKARLNEQNPTLELISMFCSVFVRDLQKILLESFPAEITALEVQNKIIPFSPYKDQSRSD